MTPLSRAALLSQRYYEPPYGLIPEQGACPLRPKGARSKAKNKKGAGSRERVILEQGAEFFQTKKEHEAENSNPAARNTKVCMINDTSEYCRNRYSRGHPD